MLFFFSVIRCFDLLESHGLSFGETLVFFVATTVSTQKMYVVRNCLYLLINITIFNNIPYCAIKAPLQGQNAVIGRPHGGQTPLVAGAGMRSGHL